ncbi:MAG: hypothetical protein WCH34_12045 [Bacteroidota bacterium]
MKRKLILLALIWVLSHSLYSQSVQDTVVDKIRRATLKVDVLFSSWTLFYPILNKESRDGGMVFINSEYFFKKRSSIEITSGYNWYFLQNEMSRKKYFLIPEYKNFFASTKHRGVYVGLGLYGSYLYHQGWGEYTGLEKRLCGGLTGTIGLQFYFHSIVFDLTTHFFYYKSLYYSNSRNEVDDEKTPRFVVLPDFYIGYCFSHKPKKHVH